MPKNVLGLPDEILHGIVMQFGPPSLYSVWHDVEQNGLTCLEEVPENLRGLYLTSRKWHGLVQDVLMPCNHLRSTHCAQPERIQAINVGRRLADRVVRFRPFSNLRVYCATGFPPTAWGRVAEHLATLRNLQMVRLALRHGSLGPPRWPCVQGPPSDQSDVLSRVKYLSISCHLDVRNLVHLSQWMPNTEHLKLHTIPQFPGSFLREGLQGLRLTLKTLHLRECWEEDELDLRYLKNLECFGLCRSAPMCTVKLAASVKEIAYRPGWWEFGFAHSFNGFRPLWECWKDVAPGLQRVELWLARRHDFDPDDQIYEDGCTRLQREFQQRGLVASVDRLH